jgi:hypothetical protein
MNYTLQYDTVIPMTAMYVRHQTTKRTHCPNAKAAAKANWQGRKQENETTKRLNLSAVRLIRSDSVTRSDGLGLLL